MKTFAAVALTLALADHAAATPLHDAIEQNDVAAVVALLDAGADPNLKNERGLSPLLLSMNVSGDTTAVIVALLDAGADPNRSYPPVLRAAYRGIPETITALLGAGANPNARDRKGNTPLHRAAGPGHTAAVTALLAAGANPNVENAEKYTPLYLAAGRGRTATIAALLDGGANPRILDVMVASALRHTEVVATLVAHMRTKPNIGLLCFAAAKGHVDTVVALLDVGTEPNAKCWGGTALYSGSTALHLAVDNGRRAVVTALLEASADPNVEDDDNGNTPLHLAVVKVGTTATAVATALLDAGADPNARNHRGRSPLDVAVFDKKDVLRARM